MELQTIPIFLDEFHLSLSLSFLLSVLIFFLSLFYSLPLSIYIHGLYMVCDLSITSFLPSFLVRALLMGITQVFVLSTRTMQWFEERGT